MTKMLSIEVRLLLLMLAGASVAQAQDAGSRKPFSWPVSASSLAMRGEISRQYYTDEEHRNVQTVMEQLNGVGRAVDPERWMSKDRVPPKPGRRAGFYVLDEAFGGNDYRIGSLADRINTIEDIVAKGDRVVVTWRITGTLNGPMFTFEGLGQPIDMREMMTFRFDRQGKILEMAAWSGEDLLFYEQLGGRIELPPRLPSTTGYVQPHGNTDGHP